MDWKRHCLLAVLAATAGILWACADSGDGRLARPGSPPSFPTTPAPATSVAVAGMPEDVQGVYKVKCAVCHGPEAKGVRNAPNLFEVERVHSADEWAAYLRDPKIWNEENLMPVVELTDDEARKLAEWLAATTGRSGGSQPASALVGGQPSGDEGGE